MHILLLSPNFAPEVNAPATRQYEHCKRWAAAGHEVTVITPAPNWPTGKVFPGYRNQWKNEQQLDGIRVIRVWTFISANQGFLLRTLCFLSYMLRAIWAALFIRKVDVLVATSPQFFAGLAGAVASRLKGCPFVLEIRDIWPESIVEVGAMRQSWTIRALEWLEHRMYGAAEHIVTVGEGYRQKLIERGVAEQRISIVTNGVDLDTWRPSPPDEELRRRWNGEGKLVCSYVGTIGMAHGLEVVLDAAEKLQQARPDIVFWLVGDGARRQTLQDDAQRRGLSNVVFTGQVTKEQVRQVIATADACLVHLRGTELFGTVIPSKIFETMAMNTPIIMGVRGQAQELVMDARGGVPMTPDDANSLISCLEQIAAEPDAFTQGRQYVAQFFDRNSLARDMLNTLACHARMDDERRIAEPVVETVALAEDPDAKVA